MNYSDLVKKNEPVASFWRSQNGIVNIGKGSNFLCTGIVTNDKLLANEGLVIRNAIASTEPFINTAAFTFSLWCSSPVEILNAYVNVKIDSSGIYINNTLASDKNFDLASMFLNVRHTAGVVDVYINESPEVESFLIEPEFNNRSLGQVEIHAEGLHFASIFDKKISDLEIIEQYSAGRKEYGIDSGVLAVTKSPPYIIPNINEDTLNNGAVGMTDSLFVTWDLLDSKRVCSSQNILAGSQNVSIPEDTKIIKFSQDVEVTINGTPAENHALEISGGVWKIQRKNLAYTSNASANYTLLVRENIVIPSYVESAGATKTDNTYTFDQTELFITPNETVSPGQYVSTSIDNPNIDITIKWYAGSSEISTSNNIGEAPENSTSFRCVIENPYGEEQSFSAVAVEYSPTTLEPFWGDSGTDLSGLKYSWAGIPGESKSLGYGIPLLGAENAIAWQAGADDVWIKLQSDGVGKYVSSPIERTPGYVTAQADFFGDEFSWGWIELNDIQGEKMSGAMRLVVSPENIQSDNITYSLCYEGSAGAIARFENIVVEDSAYVMDYFEGEVWGKELGGFAWVDNHGAFVVGPGDITLSAPLDAGVYSISARIKSLDSGQATLKIGGSEVAHQFLNHDAHEFVLSGVDVADQDTVTVSLNSGEFYIESVSVVEGNAARDMVAEGMYESEDTSTIYIPKETPFSVYSLRGFTVHSENESVMTCYSDTSTQSNETDHPLVIEGTSGAEKHAYTEKYEYAGGQADSIIIRRKHFKTCGVWIKADSFDSEVFAGGMYVNGKYVEQIHTNNWVFVSFVMPEDDFVKLSGQNMRVQQICLVKDELSSTKMLNFYYYQLMPQKYNVVGNGVAISDIGNSIVQNDWAVKSTG